MTENPLNNTSSEAETNSQQIEDSNNDKKHFIYTSKFYIALVSFLLVGFLIINVLNLLQGAYLALISVSIQSTVLYFIVTKNKYVKLGLKIWGGLMTLTGGLRLFSMLLYLIIQRYEMVNSFVFYQSSIYLIFGILIIVFSEKTILEIKK